MKFMIQLAGLLQIALAFLHFPIAKHLKWKEELQKTNALTRQIFWVHSFFICLLLLLIGLPSVIAPQLLTTRNDLRLTVALCLAIFWGLRLLFQLFVYSPEHRRGKTFETIVHWIFTALWVFLTATYTFIVVKHIWGN
jgi:hypothetical protein